jgi:hypothetical protein
MPFLMEERYCQQHAEYDIRNAMCVLHIFLAPDMLARTSFSIREQVQTALLFDCLFRSL